jgi:hypothetical protein
MPASLMGPSLKAAIQRCHDQADVGMNMPWAFYNLGIFHLLLGQPYESLSAYAKAIQLSSTDWMIETSLRLLEKLSVIHEMVQGYDWVCRLLIISRAVKFHEIASLEQIRKLVTANTSPITGPVVIIAGGTNADVQIVEYQQLLLDGFHDFRGTVIGGGTIAGVSGLVGQVQAASPKSISTIGYVPEFLPPGEKIDPQYQQVRSTGGKVFSALEPLQYWIDIISAGISPAQVKLIGINGGEIAALEYRLALMLGANIAVIESSGREAARLFKDPYWGNSERLLRLSATKKDLGSFICPGN